MLKETLKDSQLFEAVLGPDDITVKFNSVGSLLGYPEGRIPAFFCSLIETALLDLRKMLDIRAGFRILDMSASAAKDNISDKYPAFDYPDRITSYLRNSEHLIAFIITIGPAPENKVKELTGKGDLPAAFVYDSAASAAAEAAAEALHRHLKTQMLKKGLKVTNRYSPGYCGWNVSEQQKLFSLFPDGFCGITLTESSLMIPVKSVSGVIGAGRTAKYSAYSCRSCTLENCMMRKKK